MRILITGLFALLVSMTAFAQVESQPAPAAEVEEVPAVDQPQVEFDSLLIDYGLIEHASDPYRVFNFENKGDEPVIITYAKGSCGCTIPEYPKEPIMPGEKSEIKVRYDTKRVGRFSKTVTLNIDGLTENIVLRIKGEVKPVAPEAPGTPEKESNPFSN